MADPQVLLADLTCARCGTWYDVEQGESHHTWWSWRRTARTAPAEETR